MYTPFIRKLPSSGDYLNRKDFTIDNFSGGLNNVDSELLLLDNQVLDCRNMMFSDNFSIEKRYGSSYLFEAVPETDETEASDSYGEKITWYDEFRINDNEVYTITASENKLFVNDEFLCVVQGDVEGCSFNGDYYFVDGAFLYKIDFQSYNTIYEVFKIVEDPKVYVNRFAESVAVTNPETLEQDIVTLCETVEAEVTTTKYIHIGEYNIDNPDNIIEYSSSDTYYADPYGKKVLEHGSEHGKVNNETYTNYYKKEETTGTKKGVKIKGFLTNKIPENVSVEDTFTFNSNLLFAKTTHDLEYTTDVVTGIVSYTDKTDYEPIEFVITEIDYITGCIYFERVEEEHGIKNCVLWSDDLDDMWLDYTNDEEKIKTINKTISYLNNNFTNMICRCYIPRDKKYNNGEIVTTEEGLMWYQPCRNELDYAFLGENYLPNNPRNICVYKGRIWTTGDYGQLNEIRACNVNQPFYFPAAMSLAMVPTGDAVKDIFEFDNSLIVGRRNDVYSVTGSSTSAGSGDLFSIKKLDATTGFFDKNCGALINNYYLFLGSDGKLYKMNTPTTNIDYLMIRPITTYIDLFRPPLSFNKDDIKNLSCVALDNNVFWCIDDKILLYSYDHQSFLYFTDLDATVIYTDGVELKFGTSNGSRCKWDKTIYNDRGNPISCKLKTKAFDLGSPIYYKFFEQLLVTMDKPELSNSSVDIRVLLDGSQRIAHGGVFYHFVINSGVYGVSKWNRSVFSSAPFAKTQWIQLNGRSRTISYEFLNETTDETFRILSVNTVYTTRDLR